MERRYDGSLEFSNAQRRLLLALWVGPMPTLHAVERGLVDAAQQLKQVNLVEWSQETGWRLTPDGATLAKRIAAS